MIVVALKSSIINVRLWPLADRPLAAAFDAFLPLASAAMFERLHKVW